MTRLVGCHWFTHPRATTICILFKKFTSLRGLRRFIQLQIIKVIYEVRFSSTVAFLAGGLILSKKSKSRAVLNCLGDSFPSSSLWFTRLAMEYAHRRLVFKVLSLESIRASTISLI